MSKRSGLMFTIFFAAVLAVAFTVSLFIRDESGRELEARELADFPALNELLNGSFGTGFESWYADHFAFRSAALKANSYYKKLTTRSYSQSLYTGKENYLFPREYFTHNIRWAANDVVNLAAARPELPFYYVSLPRKAHALSELLPDYIDKSWLPQNKEFLSYMTVPVIDVTSYVQDLPLETRKTFYFKGDSHWNADGAFAAFLYIIDRLGADGIIENTVTSGDYTRRVLDNVKLLGDLNRQTNYVLSKDEPIIYYDYSGGSDWSYRSSDGGKVWAPGLGRAEMSYNDAYTYNLGRYTIDSPGALNDMKLLIIKDSMQNAMADWFPVLFSETDVVDLRYYDGYIEDVVNNSDADLILILYNSGSMAGDMFRFWDTNK